ncbi:tetratricopeptide repeat protein [Siculibacillus lacustris]|uniref:Tetratricopeptide repeat protein n=1 Tax=Siculibacillus lacustris TaxID=1549641 RepID=A0A4Q9VUR0_9HYPH|nr:tetratricopeptide repeat protein [Siculibacillus lacustris]TBW39806.1 tetratricopeptide repeat protein [Siculibacillus lacustris]
MADIFNEIDEELRREQIHKLWDRYGVLVLVAAVAVVVAVAGWRGWDHWQSIRARAQGDSYAAAAEIARSGDAKGAEEAFLALARSGSGGYPALASLRAAATLAEGGDAAAALKAFDGLAASGSTPALLADIAKIRAAYLAVDLEDRAVFEARVTPLAAAGRPYRHQGRELLALSAWKAGDAVAAGRWLAEIDADPETPRSLLERTAVLSALVQAQATSGKAN